MKTRERWTQKDEQPIAHTELTEAISLWQPRSWRFMLLRTLNDLPQPRCGQRNGFSPVWLCMWILRLDGRLKALLHVGHR